METPSTTPPPPQPEKKKYSGLGIVFFLIALTGSLISAFGNYWPTNKIIEIQANMFDGSYYVKLTYLLTLLVYWLPLLAVQKIN